MVFLDVSQPVPCQDLHWGVQRPRHYNLAALRLRYTKCPQDIAQRSSIGALGLFATVRLPQTVPQGRGRNEGPDPSVRCPPHCQRDSRNNTNKLRRCMAKQRREKPNHQRKHRKTVQGNTNFGEEAGQQSCVAIRAALSQAVWAGYFCLRSRFHIKKGDWETQERVDGVWEGAF